MKVLKIAEPYGIQLTSEIDSLEKLEVLFDTVTAGSPVKKERVEHNFWKVLRGDCA